MMNSFNQPLPDKPEMTYVTTYYPDTVDPAAARKIGTPCCALFQRTRGILRFSRSGIVAHQTPNPDVSKPRGPRVPLQS